MCFLYNLHIIFHKINGYIEDHDGRKYLALIYYSQNIKKKKAKSKH